MRSTALIRSHAWYCLPEYFLATFGPDAAPANWTATASLQASRPEFDRFGDALPKMRMTDQGIALVPIHGALLKGASGSDKFFLSVTSHEDIAEDIDAAVDSGARGILLHCKSGGGTVTGSPELAAKVSELNRSGFPIASYTEDLLCSAVEMITAGCTIRLATPSARVGSIGVIWERLDATKYFEALGLQYNVFTSGKYKATGNANTKLTDEQTAFLQSYVDARGEEFRAHMLANRPQIPPEAMEGQIFSGHEAAQIGLIDATVSGLREALSFFGTR